MCCPSAPPAAGLGAWRQADAAEGREGEDEEEGEEERGKDLPSSFSAIPDKREDEVRQGACKLLWVIFTAGDTALRTRGRPHLVGWLKAASGVPPRSQKEYIPSRGDK